MVIPLGTLTCGPSRPEKQDGFRVRGQIARRARPIVSSPDCESSTMFLLGLVLRLFSSERPDFGLSVTPLFGGASPLLAGFLSQSGLAKKIFVGQALRRCSCARSSVLASRSCESSRYE